MSDNPQQPAAPVQIEVYKRQDASLVAHVHVADKLRTVFAESLDQLKRRVVSALIGEFGMVQDAAHAVADEHGLAPGVPAFEHWMLSQAYDVAMKERDELGAQVTDLHAHCEQLAEHTADLENQIKALTVERDDLRQQLTVAMRPSDAGGATGATGPVE